MNERIRELWRQAVLNNTKTPMNFQDVADEFAQLIVAECIKLNGKELAMPGHSRMVDVYCEHFGIEL